MITIEKLLTKKSIIKQIVFFYFLVLIISIFISLNLFSYAFKNVKNRKVDYTTRQTLGSLNQNFNNIIDSVNGISKLIMSSDKIQQLLTSTDKLNSLERGDYKLYISTLIDNVPYIESAHIYNLEDNILNVNEFLPGVEYPRNLKNIWWYNYVLNAKGGAKVISSGITLKSNGSSPIINHIRVINSMDTFKPIGVLILNFDVSKILETPGGLISLYNPQIVINGQWGNTIYNSSEVELSEFPLKRNEIIRNKIIQKSIKYNRKEYQLSSIKNNFDLSISIITPVEFILSDILFLSLITIILILFNSILMFLGGVIISKYITTPLYKLVKVMNKSDSNELVFAKFDTPNKETTDLVKGYNNMVLEIKSHISKELESEKRKRQLELQIMQEQIKPHFLYNTFDAIGSLALEGKNKEVYKAIIALGGFYNASLNHGNEIIPLKEEIDTVINYLNIQKIRYEDLFTTEYNIDSTLESIPVLKLILQPLVENSIYHGLKNKGESGVISVTAKKDSNYIILSVADDGIGISNKKISELLTPIKSSLEEKSFGLRATIERLNIFYQNRNSCEIYINKMGGTTITFKLPIDNKE